MTAVFLCALAGFAAWRTLPLIPEHWLRELWEPPVPRLSPSRRELLLFLFAGALAGLLLFRGETGSAAFSFASLIVIAALFLLFQIAYIDFFRRVIPDQHLLLLTLLGLLRLLVSAFSAVNSGASSGLPFVAALCLLFSKAFGSAVLCALPALFLAFPELFGRNGLLGLGDVKLFAALGFLLGAIRPSEHVRSVLSLVLYAFLLNGLFALVALLLRRTEKTGALPMAPAILLAFLVLSMY